MIEVSFKEITANEFSEKDLLYSDFNISVVIRLCFYYTYYAGLGWWGVVCGVGKV